MDQYYKPFGWGEIEDLGRYYETEEGRRAFRFLTTLFSKNTLTIAFLKLIAQNIELFRLFEICDCVKFINIEKALSAISYEENSRHKVLIYFSNINLYGLFSMSEYEEFHNLRKNNDVLAKQPIMLVMPKSSNFVTVGVRGSRNHNFEVKIHEITRNANITINEDLDNTFYTFYATTGMMTELNRYYTYIMMNAVRELKISLNEQKYIIIRVNHEFITALFQSDMRSNETLNILPTEPFDTQPYVNKYCLYVLQMNVPNTNCFKYGITKNINKRLSKHRSAIHYLKVVKIFIMSSQVAMENAEREYKKLARDRQINVVRLKYTEVVTTDNLQYELNILNNIVEKHNNIICDDVMSAVASVNLNFEDSVENNTREQDQKAAETYDKYTQARKWIGENPPHNREITTNYYKRYQESTTGDAVHDNQFGAIVRSYGYTQKKGTNVRFWDVPVSK